MIEEKNSDRQMEAMLENYSSLCCSRYVYVEKGNPMCSNCDENCLYVLKDYIQDDLDKLNDITNSLSRY